MREDTSPNNANPGLGDSVQKIRRILLSVEEKLKCVTKSEQTRRVVSLGRSGDYMMVSLSFQGPSARPGDRTGRNWDRGHNKTTRIRARHHPSAWISCPSRRRLLQSSRERVGSETGAEDIGGLAEFACNEEKRKRLPPSNRSKAQQTGPAEGFQNLDLQYCIDGHWGGCPKTTKKPPPR